MGAFTFSKQEIVNEKKKKIVHSLNLGSNLIVHSPIRLFTVGTDVNPLEKGIPTSVRTSFSGINI